MTTAAEPQVVFVSSLDEFERRFSIPLLTMGQSMARSMVARISRGQGAQQPMAPMGAYAEDRDDRSRRFWAKPGRPQPEGDGFLARHETGPRAGWALYRSYRAWADLVGHGAPRDLEETGAFLRSIRVRALSPARVKVAPYGTHAGPSGERISNTSLGFLGSRREPLPLLHPSPQEIQAAAAELFRHVDGTAIEAAAIAGEIAPVRRAATSVQRRVSELGTRR